MATKNIVPNADSEGGIGTSSKYWATGFIDAITTTGNLVVGGSVTSNDLILTAGTLFGTGNTGFSNRSSDTTLYLQMPATGFNITDNALNTRFILSSGGAATFSTNSNSSIVNHFTNSDTTNTSTRNTIELTAGNRFLQLQAYNGDHIYFNRSSGSNLYFQSGGSSQMLISSGGDATFSGKLSVSKSSTDFIAEFQNTNGTNPYGVRVKDASTPANNYPLFSVSNSGGTVEYFRVNSGTGNVGIGTSSTEGKLTLSYTAAELPNSGTTSNSAIQIISSLNNQLNIGLNTASESYGSYIQSSDNNLAVPYPLNLQPNGGNVGIGVKPDTNSRLTIKGSGDSSTSNSIAVYNSTNASIFTVRDDGVSTFSNYIDTPEVRQGGEFMIGRSSNIIRVGSGDGSDSLAFYAGGSQAMSISTLGTLVNTANSNNGSTAIFKNNSSTTPYGIAVELPNGSSDDTRYLFYGGLASNAPRFKVSTSGKIYALDTSQIYSISDVRFKENIRDLDTGLSEILQLKPRLFDWKEGKGTDTKNSVGFIAQEIEEILPKLVDDNWSEEGINEKGAVIEGEKYKTVGQIGLIPTLVKAIQEQQTIIEDLKSRIETLEG